MQCYRNVFVKFFLLIKKCFYECRLLHQLKINYWKVRYIWKKLTAISFRWKKNTTCLVLQVMNKMHNQMLCFAVKFYNICIVSFHNLCIHMVFVVKYVHESARSILDTLWDYQHDKQIKYGIFFLFNKFAFPHFLSLFQVGNHGNDKHIFLPNHLPKVPDCLRFRSYYNYVLSLYFNPYALLKKRIILI